MLESMPDAQVITWTADKYTAIEADLDKRARRRWAAAEARSLGWGRIAAVANDTGISERTIRRRVVELTDPNAASFDRPRSPGAGRKSGEVEQPKLAVREFAPAAQLPVWYAISRLSEMCRAIFV